MSKATTPKPPQRFDLQKFESMNEPFSVRVEKHKGSLKYEITPPVPDDAGWTKERVRGLETWIVTEWSGGGHYTFAITDSSAPPQTMEWTSYYPVNEYQEKIPPTLQSAAITPSAPQQVQAQASPPAKTNFTIGTMPPASYYQPSAANSLPTLSPVPATGQIPVSTGNFNPSGAQQQMNQNMPPQWGQGTSQSQENAEMRAMREELTRAREQAAQREYERRMAEMEARSDKRFVELQQLVQQMVQAQQQTRPAVDPVVEQLKEQNRNLQEQMRQQAEQSDRTRREQELRDQIRQSQEETRRQIDVMNQRHEQLMREATSKNDPQAMMLMETMKEIARNSQAQFDRLQHLMMRPQDMLAIAKESSQSTEHVVSNIARQYEAMFGLARQLTEQAAQLNQGGGNEVIGLVRDIGDKVGDWASRYTTGKSREAVEQARAQAEMARANAEAVRATQERMADMARAETAARNGTVRMPDGTFRAPPGPEPVAIPAATTPPGKPWVKNGASPGSGLGGAGGQVVQLKPERRIKGRTEDEWFGPMLPDVNRLRDAVASFIEGVNRTPPEKPEDSAAPEECAFVINQAATEIAKAQLPIPALVDLLFEGSVAEFLDVLLPDAPQIYRDDVAKLLLADEPSEDDEDADVDESDDAAS